MASKYLLFPKAKEDLKAIFSYISIELVNPEGALKLINKFESKFQGLVDFPKAYPRIENPSVQQKNLRKCSIDNFLIVYFHNEESDSIEIVRVIHIKEDHLFNAL